MTARRDVPLWWLLVLRIRLKLLVWRYLALRAAWRLVRRAAGWLAPAGLPDHHRNHRAPP